MSLRRLALMMFRGIARARRYAGPIVYPVPVSGFPVFKALLCEVQLRVDA